MLDFFHYSAFSYNHFSVTEVTYLKKENCDKHRPKGLSAYTTICLDLPVIPCVNIFSSVI